MFDKISRRGAARGAVGAARRAARLIQGAEDADDEACDEARHRNARLLPLRRRVILVRILMCGVGYQASDDMTASQRKSKAEAFRWFVSRAESHRDFRMGRGSRTAGWITWIG